MSNTNSYGDISPKVAGKAAARLLDRGQSTMVLERFGQFDPQPKHKTKTRKWRRYLSLPPATAPLAEGISPAGQKLRHEDIEATLEQYGDIIKLTDVIADLHDDPILQQSMDLCGEQAADTIELLRYYVLRGGSNVSYANGVTSRAAVNSPAKRSDFRKIYRAFKRNKAKTIGRIIKATAEVATEPVAPAFFSLGHTDLLPDLEDLIGWVPVEKYSNADKALPNEVGKLDQFRFILSELFAPWEAVGASGTDYLSGGEEVSSAANCDVYPILCIAQNAYGIVPLQGENAVKPMVLNPGEPRGDDPMGQKGFVSWKTYQAAVILNQSWMVRLEVAASANPS